jgi:hypothetical protein
MATKTKKSETTETSESTAVAVATSSFAEGDFNQNDIIMPEIKLSQGAGALGDWPKGQLVVDAEFEVEKPAIITVLSYKKQYVEYIPYGTGETSRFFNTEEEVVEAGLSLKWADNQRPTANAIMDTMICVHGGKDADPAQFPYDFKGERYLFCLWRIKGTSYDTAAKPIVTADSTYLKGNIRKGSFILEPKKAENSKGSWWVSQLKRKGLNDDDFVAFLGEFM